MARFYDRSLLCSWLLLAACGETQARTQVMLEIDAEPEIRTAMQALQVIAHVLTDGGYHWKPAFDQRYGADMLGSFAEFKWPARLGLVPAGGDARRIFAVQARALDGDDEIIVWQSAAAGFTQGATTVLRVMLIDACRADKPLAQSCGEPTCVGSQCFTCRKGACEEVGILKMLPVYREGERHDAGAASPGDAGDTDAAPANPIDARVPPIDAGTDAGRARPDAGKDAGKDSGNPVSKDAGHDAGSDTGTDAGPPFTVSNSSPANAAQIDYPDTPVVVKFSAPLNQGSVSADRFVVERDGVPVAGTVATTAMGASFTPTLPWALAASYSARLTAEIESAAGQKLVAYSFDFTMRDGVWSAQPFSTADDDAPRFAALPDGRAAVAWLRTETYAQVWASRFTPPGNWSTPMQVSRATQGASARYSALINEAGHAAVLWNYDNAVWGSGLLDTTSWGDPVAIDGSADQASAIFGSGDTVLVAMQLNRATRTIGGISFVAGEVGVGQLIDIGGSVSGVVDDQPVVTSLGGSPFVAWRRTPNPGASEIYASSFVAGGGQRLSAMGGGAFNPVLAHDGALSAVIALYEQPDNGVNSVFTARIEAQGATWSTPQAISTAQIIASSPALAMDRSGRALAAWREGGVLVSSQFVLGQGWSMPAPIAEAGAANVDPPSVVLEPGGNGFVAWTQDGAMSINEVWFARYIAGRGFTPAQRISELDAGTASTVGACIDASGRGFVGWYQANSLYIARFQ